MVHYMNVWMKTALVFSLVACAALSAQAQKHEIGLRLSGIESFGFIYKKQKNNGNYMRHRLGLARANVFIWEDANSVNLNLGYAFGIEKRKSIGPKTSFIHGFEPALLVSYNYSKNDTESNTSTSIIPTLGYVLGFQYAFSEDFYVNIEAVPSISSNIGGRPNAFGFNAGFNSEAVSLTLAHRF